jgi:hypothetical protein
MTVIGNFKHFGSLGAKYRLLTNSN